MNRHIQTPFKLKNPGAESWTWANFTLVVIKIGKNNLVGKYEDQKILWSGRVEIEQSPS